MLSSSNRDPLIYPRVLRTHLLRLYNDVLRADAPPPQDWKHTTISVIHKSGDTGLPNNYRPISIIPLLYKLFARLLYNRLWLSS